MKFLIAGLGSIGRRHLDNLLTLGQEDVLLYRTHHSTLPDADTYDFPVETDLQAALDHNPDAVIVSNPTALHLDVAIPSAEAGCHLFLEKPISNSMDRIDVLKKAVKRGCGQVFTGFQFRFHPGLQLIKRFLNKGAIGRPLSVRAHWGEFLPHWHPWEDYRSGYSARPDLGGGVILTLCHPLDYLRWMLGEVKDLWAFTGQLSDMELQVEDVAEIGLKFANGVLGSIHLDFFQHPPTHHLEILGTTGTIKWDNSDGVARVFQTEFGEWQEFLPPAGFERNDMYITEMRHFISVLKGESLPLCTLEDGVSALVLALAAHESQQHTKMVRL